jgi:hypothetical protein
MSRAFPLAAALAFVVTLLSARTESVQESGPRLSPESAAEQNGNQFLGATPIDEAGRSQLGRTYVFVGKDMADGVGIWIKTPAPEPGSTPPAWISLTDGTSFKLTPQYACVTAAGGAGAETWTCYALPRGYSGSTRTAEVTLKGPDRKISKWKVINLPPSHALEGKRPTTLALTDAGVTLKAGAWWLDPIPGYFYRYVHVTVESRGSPKPPHHWEISIDSALQKWQPAKGEPETANWYPELKAGKSGISWAFITFYPSHQSKMRVSGRVQEFACFDETVTFRDLPVVREYSEVNRRETDFLSLRKPRLARTPCGIVLTIPAQNESGRAPEDSGYGGGLHFKVTIPVEAKPVELPGSPLSRKWAKKPLAIELMGSKPPYVLEAWRSRYPERDVTINYTGRLPDTIPRLTLVIRHRIDLRSFPYSLDAAIQPALPPERLRKLPGEQK